MGSGSLLPLHLRKPADGPVRRNRREYALWRRETAIPYCGGRRLPVTKACFEGNLSARGGQRAGRPQVGFYLGRCRIFLLIGNNTKLRKCWRLGKSCKSIKAYAMTNWVRWVAPAVIAVPFGCPAQAVEYL